MKQNLIIITFVFFGHFLYAQSNQVIYDQAFEKLNCQLNGSCELNFKVAVFTVENAYLSNTLDRERFDKQIKILVDLTQQLIVSRDLIYNLEDKAQVEKCAALFSVMTDTIPIQLDTNRILKHPPFSYDFTDIWGHKSWTNMFVSELLDTKQGNCHSMPYLYKILADEIGANANISVAPNHFYIKHQNKANGWYNTELTSGIFPIDAWLMASGYIHLDAVVNKLYMEALNEKQSIALCMIDLAKGYQRKSELIADNEFILKCCDTALKYYPNYINGLLLKAETKKKQFDWLMEKNYAEYPSDIFHLPEAQQLFTEMTQLYAKIQQLGYRKMPKEMYLNWLVSLKEERNKYENKNIINFNTKSK